MGMVPPQAFQKKVLVWKLLKSERGWFSKDWAKAKKSRKNNSVGE